MSAVAGDRAPLVGREVERARIDELLGAAAHGRGGALVVRGEPGLGKTTLLAYARDQAQEATVLSTRGLQAESDLPFAGLSDLLAPVLGNLAGLSAPQRAALEGALALGPAVPGDRFATYVGLLSILAAAAEEAPLLVLVDDVQWLDSASAEALLFVARRLEHERIALLLALREGEPSRLAEGDLSELRLGGLDSETSQVLLARQGRDLPAAVAERLWEATAGNPLALLELPSMLSEAQLEGRDTLEDPLPLVPSLEDVYRGRVEALPEPTRKALTIAAANDSGSQREVMLALRTRGIPSEALSPAEVGGVISMSGERVEFRHPLLRSAAYHCGSGPERRAAHEALAEVLATDPSPARRAWHRAAAALAPDEDVANELEEAANEALARGAPGAAASAREVAARLSPEAEGRARRLQESGRDAWVSGRSTEAARLLDEALAQSDDQSFRADTKRIRGHVEMVAGEIPVARSLFLEAADAVSTYDASRAAGMLADAAATLLQEGKPPQALETIKRAEALKPLEPDDVERLVLHANAESLCGNSGRGLELGRQVRPLLDDARAYQHPWLVPGFAFNWACLSFEEDALRLIDRFLEQARTAGALAVVPYALVGKCSSEFVLGAWRSAYAAGTEALRLAEEAEQKGMVANAHAYAARVAAGRGETARCRTHVQAAIVGGERHGALSIDHVARAALGLLELGLGRPESAARELDSLEDDLLGLRQPTVLRSGGDHVEAHLRAGHTHAAERALIRLEEEAELTDGSWARAVAARCRGLLSEEAEFETCFEEALRLHAEVASPFSRGRTLLCYGERLRRARRRVGARGHLRGALEIFERLEARPWVERAQQELVATGERLARRPELQARSELTAQELRVALQVAEGKTNREVAAALFVTPKTVEAHLGRAYRKLGVSSRAQLTRLLSR